jgi:hypothetical protein
LREADAVTRGREGAVLAHGDEGLEFVDHAESVSKRDGGVNRALRKSFDSSSVQG